MAERFGNYEILRRIAAGGMAEVFLAKQTGLGGFERLVCIKRILPHLGEQDDFIKMFQDEARIAANLIHPNIAQIYDIGEVHDSYYIAMEYVRGEDLRRIYNQEVARGRAMPLEPAAQIVMGAAAALDYAHRQTTIDGRPLGIVHRDISPQNILVTYDGHVKLVDFGVAKAAGKMTETRTGVLKGKYSYMSPEQASGDPIDGRTDIFALGITLYEVTTGVRLFKRDNEIETLHAVIECNVTPPSQILPGYDDELEAIIMRALAFDPDNRWGTAGDVAQQLEAWLIRRGHPTGASSLGGYMQDLFAEKLADELLFGGQLWDERLTPSRPSTRRVQGDSDPQPPLGDATAATDAFGEDNTVIDEHEPSQVDNGPNGSEWSNVDEASDHKSGGWGLSTSSSQTATRDPVQEAPALPQRQRHDTSTQTEGRPPWLAWALGGGALSAVAIIFFLVGRLVSGPEEQPRSGQLIVESEPRGARVVFLGPGAAELNERYDGRGYRTPFTISEGVPVASGLRARFLKDGFEVVERELPALKEGVVPEPLFAELTLVDEKAQAGSLILLSTPSGADVYLDGNKVEGKTPLADIRVRGGETHKVEYHLQGYEARSETVYVEPGSRRFIEMALFASKKKAESKAEESAAAPSSELADKRRSDNARPAGGRAYITVTSPLKLRVSVGGRFVGETPLRRLAVEPGLQRISLASPSEGFSTRRKVRLAAGRTETIDVKPQKGNLALNATPWAWVRLGKASPSETPVRLQVYEGDYEVTFECPDGRKKVEHAHVNADQTSSVSVSCRD